VRLICLRIAFREFQALLLRARRARLVEQPRRHRYPGGSILRLAIATQAYCRPQERQCCRWEIRYAGVDVRIIAPAIDLEKSSRSRKISAEISSFGCRFAGDYSALRDRLEDIPLLANDFFVVSLRSYRLRIGARQEARPGQNPHRILHAALSKLTGFRGRATCGSYKTLFKGHLRRRRTF